MEFKFNFCDSAEDGEKKKEENKVNEKEVTIQRYQSFSVGDIQEEWKKSSDIELCCIESLKLNEGEILYMQTYTDAYCDVGDNTETDANLANKAIPNILDTSDLIPKVYEGGLKLWESCLDLVQFLEKQENKDLLQGKHVMEVGCGFGLPGILAAKYGAKKVVFQDYNHFVIFNATGPSVFLNECKTKESDDATLEPKRLKTEDDNDVMDSFEKFLETDIKTECQYSFLSGDWGEVAQNVDMKFETILTAETIYDVANYENLHRLLERCLHQDGCVILAAKSFYFGVGGGIELWREFVEKKNIFRTDVAEVVEASVKREILKMTFIDAKPKENKNKVNK